MKFVDPYCLVDRISGCSDGPSLDESGAAALATITSRDIIRSITQYIAIPAIHDRQRGDYSYDMRVHGRIRSSTGRFVFAKTALLSLADLWWHMSHNTGGIHHGKALLSILRQAETVILCDLCGGAAVHIQEAIRCFVSAAVNLVRIVGARNCKLRIFIQGEGEGGVLDYSVNVKHPMIGVDCCSVALADAPPAIRQRVAYVRQYDTTDAAAISAAATMCMFENLEHMQLCAALANADAEQLAAYCCALRNSRRVRSVRFATHAFEYDWQPPDEDPAAVPGSDDRDISMVMARVLRAMPPTVETISIDDTTAFDSISDAVCAALSVEYLLNCSAAQRSPGAGTFELASLRELEVDGDSGTGFYSLPPLSHFPNLRVLEVRCCRLASLRGADRLTRLEAVRFSCEGSADELEQFVTECASDRLREVCIESSSLWFACAEGALRALFRRRGVAYVELSESMRSLARGFVHRARESDAQAQSGLYSRMHWRHVASMPHQADRKHAIDANYLVRVGAMAPGDENDPLKVCVMASRHAHQFAFDDNDVRFGWVAQRDDESGTRVARSLRSHQVAISVAQYEKFAEARRGWWFMGAETRRCVQREEQAQWRAAGECMAEASRRFAAAAAALRSPKRWCTFGEDTRSPSAYKDAVFSVDEMARKWRYTAGRGALPGGSGSGSGSSDDSDGSDDGDDSMSDVSDATGDDENLQQHGQRFFDGGDDEGDGMANPGGSGEPLRAEGAATAAAPATVSDMPVAVHQPSDALTQQQQQHTYVPGQVPWWDEWLYVPETGSAGFGAFSSRWQHPQADLLYDESDAEPRTSLLDDSDMFEF